MKRYKMTNYKKLLIEEAFKELRELRDEETNLAIDVMKNNEQYQGEPLVGIFWYDVEQDELFGIKSTPAREVDWYKSKQWDKYVKTESRLHKQVWQKEFFKGKDKRFFGDHTKIPRGRIFEFKNEGFKVFTGSWIEDYPQVKDMILFEFDLPESTQFIQDVHWEIGHGWSDEF